MKIFFKNMQQKAIPHRLCFSIQVNKLQKISFVQRLFYLKNCFPIAQWLLLEIVVPKVFETNLNLRYHIPLSRISEKMKAMLLWKNKGNIFIPTFLSTKFLREGIHGKNYLLKITWLQQYCRVELLFKFFQKRGSLKIINL